MKINSISRNSTNVIKGIAILSMIFHSFLKTITPYNIGENEFDFTPDLIHKFLKLIGEHPFESLHLFFGYFGHYGVQLFVFISGYGLVMVMLKNNTKWLPFVVDRVKKLYPLLLTGIAVYFLWYLIIYGKFTGAYEWNIIKQKLLLMHTLIPGQGWNLIGQWWFLGLILQLYFIFPFLYKVIRRYNYVAFFVICAVCYAWIFISQYFYSDVNGVYLLQNAPGHIPEFAFGIVFALNKDKKISNWVGIIAAIVFILGNFYKLFFPFTFLSVTYLCVWGLNSGLLKWNDRNFIKMFLAFLGTISMTLFVVRGFIRLPFITMANEMNNFWITLLLLCLYMICAMGVAYAAVPLYKFVLKLFDTCIHYISIQLQKIKKIELITKIITITLIIALIISAVFITLKYAIALKKELIVETNSKNVYSAQNSDLYLHLVDDIIFDKNQNNLSATLSFDFKSNSAKENLPMVVYSVENYVWKSVPFNNLQLNTGEWAHFSATTTFYVSGNSQGKILKVYLWNPEESSFEYQNIRFRLEGR